MINIIQQAPVCNTWTTKKFDDVGKEIEICPSCSSLHTLTYQHKKSSVVLRWHIYLPESWNHGDWEQMQLRSVQVPLPVAQCKKCNQLIKIYPSFLVKGTTLTLPALIFIAFVYESSDLTWRDIPQKFCTEDDTIAHSTLYKAVHRLGKLGLSIGQELKNLYSKYFPVSNIEQFTGWPPPKSIFTHTVIRELGARRCIAMLLPGMAGSVDFCKRFYQYTDALNRIFTRLRLPPLYSIRHPDCRTAA